MPHTKSTYFYHSGFADDDSEISYEDRLIDTIGTTYPGEFQDAAASGHTTLLNRIGVEYTERFPPFERGFFQS